MDFSMTGDLSKYQITADMSQRERIEVRIDLHNHLRMLIHHPTQGMGAKGFLPYEISAAEKHLYDMVVFYEGMLEQQ